MRTFLYIITLVSTFFLLNYDKLQAQTPSFQWTKSIGDTAQILVQSVVTDAAGNVYTAGIYTGTVDFNPGAGTNILTSLTNSSAFISKLDSSGNFVWIRKIGGSSITSLRAMAISAAGDLYITGIFYGTTDFNPSIISTNNVTSAGAGDIYILKLNSSGTFVWVRTIGDNGNETGVDIKVSSSNEIYVTGDFEQTVDFNFGIGTSNITATQDDAFVLKVDASGNFIWARKLGGSGDEEPIALSLDKLGNVYTIGKFDASIDLNPSTSLSTNFNSKGQNDIYISKLDASGNYEWGKQIGNGAENYATGIANDTLGNAYIVGYFEDTLDFNPSLPFNNDLIADFTDAYILKLSAATGAFVWVKQIGGGNFDRAYDISIDEENNSYITGQFRSTCDFDPSAAVFNVSTNGNGRDLFVLKLSAAGNFIWVKATGGSGGIIIPNSITVRNANDVIVTGQFEGTVDFDDPNLFNVTASAPYSDIFIYKLNQINTSGLNTKSHSSPLFSIFPNPAHAELNIVFKNKFESSQIQIVDMLGKEIFLKEYQGLSETIDLSRLHNGIYYLHLITNGKVQGTRKFIVE